MLYGFPLVIALLVSTQPGYAIVAWGVCMGGLLAARLASLPLSNPDPKANPVLMVQRTLVETIVRISFPLAACVVAGVKLPDSQSRVIGAYLIIFFLYMLAVDRFLLLAQISSDKRAPKLNQKVPG
jgi:hypothetical protein